MHDAHSNDNTININHTFTDLFSLLKKYRATNQNLSLDYNLMEMSKLVSHTDNAITNILHGLQSIGKLVATSSLSDNEDIMQIGYFLMLIGNLMEALYSLRLDCECELVDETKQPTQGYEKLDSVISGEVI